MKRKIISGNELNKMGYDNNAVIGLAINTVHRYYRRSTRDEILSALRAVLADPKRFVEDPVWCKTALAMIPGERRSRVHVLNRSRLDYPIFGASGIEEGARNQMEIAMKLPVTVAGALMADAHQGYGLPIGGVLATRDVVIPYAVGVDIGCRMCLSIFPMSEQFLTRNKSNLKKLLLDNTCFGNETFERPKDHAVLHRKEFDEISVLRKLKRRAALQIGSSGSGNHFVEFGIVTIEDGELQQVASGKYLALLSHSGSRGMGAEIARHYTRVAKQLCILPADAANLAWLSLSSEAGEEYWQAMNLAGDYATANHDQIHERISKALGEKSLAVIQNHHNFAWKETLHDGSEIIVHRKGATPAKLNELGIIPGSMTTPGYIVRGKGVARALNSASHGAGRVLSRGEAKQTITNKMLRQELQREGVELIGGSPDEAPMAYKDINKVMTFQQELVDVVGEFRPRIVRMSGEGSRDEN